MAKIYGKAMWDCTRNPNDMTDKYEIIVAHLDKESVKTLKDLDLGHKVKKCEKEGDKHRGTYVAMQSQYPIPVKDKFKKLLGNDVAIGNGSDILAVFQYAEGTNKFGKWSKPSPKVIQVLNLVEYTGGSDGDDELDDPEGDEEAPFDLDDELD